MAKGVLCRRAIGHTAGKFRDFREIGLILTLARRPTPTTAVGR